MVNHLQNTITIPSITSFLTALFHPGMHRLYSLKVRKSTLNFIRWSSDSTKLVTSNDFVNSCRRTILALSKHPWAGDIENTGDTSRIIRRFTRRLFKISSLTFIMKPFSLCNARQVSSSHLTIDPVRKLIAPDQERRQRHLTPLKSCSIWQNLAESLVTATLRS